MDNDEESGQATASSLGANHEGSAPPTDQAVLPVASPVETPQELLDRIKELEEMERNRPVAVEVDREEVIRLEHARARRKRMLLGAAILAVLLLVGVVLGVTLPTNTAGNTVSEPPTPSPTTQEFASLQSLITSVSFDQGASLNNTASPQYKALTWLGGNENLDAYPDWRRIQRYVLAVFYYSTNGDDWTDKNGWLTDDNECEWISWAVDEKCNDDGGFLRLAILDNNLIGTIPEELALLSDTLCE